MQAKNRRRLRLLITTMAAILAFVLGWQAWRAIALREIRDRIENADTFDYDDFYHGKRSSKQFEIRRDDQRFAEVRSTFASALSHESWLVAWGSEHVGLLRCRVEGKVTLDVEVWSDGIVIDGRGFEMPVELPRKLLIGER